LNDVAKIYWIYPAFWSEIAEILYTVALKWFRFHELGLSGNGGFSINWAE